MRDKKNELTVIIPFLNEGVEVENTLISLLQHSEKNIRVLILNDASDDGFDYQKALSPYEVTYIENKERMGVAASRDLGISLCETDFFLLLDAHMRFYDSNWIGRILEELKNDSKSLLCCQTRALRVVDGELEDRGMLKTIGAYVNFYDYNRFLEPDWVFARDINAINTKKETLSIPCVLGAAYACSKAYWMYLKGLEGLLKYGSDEPFISLKVWLNGGQCKLLSDIVIGHIYRNNSPYLHDSFSRIYNRVFIAFALLPLMEKKKLYAIERVKNLEEFNNSMFSLYNNYEEMLMKKQELSLLAVRDFYDFEKKNRLFGMPKSVLSPAKKKKLIIDIILFVISRMKENNDIGLFNGQMGVLILLYHYIKFSKENAFLKYTNKLLDDTLKRVSDDLPFNLHSGFIGIGWGVEYLYQRNIISGDINEILFDIDRKIMEISPCRVTNYNLKYGLGGLVRYLLNRLYTINKEKKESPFCLDFLEEIYIKAKRIVANKDSCDCVEVYIEYILFYEKKDSIKSSSIYDILLLPSLNKYSKTTKNIGLEGQAGVALELILGF